MLSAMSSRAQLRPGARVAVAPVQALFGGGKRSQGTISIKRSVKEKKKTPVKRAPVRSPRKKTPTPQKAPERTGWFSRKKPEPEPEPEPEADTQFLSPVYKALAVEHLVVCGVAIALHDTIAVDVLHAEGVLELTNQGTSVIINTIWYLLATASLWSLSSAAENDRLSSDTYKRLNFGNFLFSASVATWTSIAFALDVNVEPIYLITTLALALPTMAACGYGVASQDNEPLLESIKKNVAIANPIGKSTYTGSYYSINFITTLLVAGAFAFAPMSPLALGPENDLALELTRRTFGLSALILLGTAQLTLTDAAERARLTGSTFKNINLACCACVWTVTGMTLYLTSALGSESFTLVNLGIAILIAGSSGGVYLAQGISPGTPKES